MQEILDSPLKIVIVEDDSGLNELIKRRLVREKYQCVQFYRAADALAWLSSNSADLMLLDMVLPDSSGEDLIYKMESNSISIPFIIATGQGSESLAVKMLKRGARDYLVKNSEFLDVLPSTVEKIWREVQIEKLLARAREQIVLQNATLSAVNDYSPDGILSVDSYDKILSYNAALLRIWKLTESRMDSFNGSDFINHASSALPPEAEFSKTVASLASDSKGLIFKELAVGSNYYEVYISPVRTDHGDISGRIWFFRDITAHKKALDVLEEARIEAENNARMRSRFFAVVSHDIKTPLNSIGGFLSLLKDSKLDETQKEYVDIAKAASSHLLMLVNDILDFTRLEHGNIEFNYADLEVFELVHDCISPFIPASQESGTNLTFEILPSVQPVISGDSLRLRQILMNLVGNAMKFTRKGSVKLTCKPDPDSKSMLLFEVADTGIGIKKEVAKFLFTPFSQADATISAKYGGSGLGLAISRQLAERMGGYIDFDSEEGKGSTFRLHIPVSHH